MSKKDERRSAETTGVPSIDARLLYRDSADPGMPEGFGLFDPSLNKASCGVGFIADIKGRKSHQIVEDALTHPVQPRAPRRGRRRSARRRRRRHPGADPAQVLRPQGQGARHHAAGARRIRHRRAVHAARRRPPRARPQDFRGGCSPRGTDRPRLASPLAGRKTFEEVATREGLTILGWRADMPVDNSTLGETVKPTEPFHMQVFIGKGKQSSARMSSSGGSTSCASRSRRRSIASTSGGCRAITRCRCRAAP